MAGHGGEHRRRTEPRRDRQRGSASRSWPSSAPLVGPPDGAQHDEREEEPQVEQRVAVVRDLEIERPRAAAHRRGCSSSRSRRRRSTTGRRVARRDARARALRGREAARRPCGRTGRVVAGRTTRDRRMPPATTRIARRHAVPGARASGPPTRLPRGGFAQRPPRPASCGSALGRSSIAATWSLGSWCRTCGTAPGVSRSHNRSAATSVSVRSTFARQTSATRSCGSACLSTSESEGPRTAITDAETPPVNSSSESASTASALDEPVTHEPFGRGVQGENEGHPCPLINSRGALGHHRRRPVRVSARERRDHGGVDDSETLDASHAKLRIDDRIGVASHPARADRVVERLRGGADVRCDSVVIVDLVTREPLLAANPASGSARATLRASRTPAVSETEIVTVGVGEEPRIDHRRRARIGRAQRDRADASRLEQHRSDGESLEARPRQPLILEGHGREHELEIR